MNAGEIASLVTAVVACLGALTAYLKSRTATKQAAATKAQLDAHVDSYRHLSK